MVVAGSAPSRRYLESESGCLRCKRRGCFVCIFCAVDALPGQCLRRTPRANPLVAAVFRTKRLLREHCSATCQRRRRPGQARHRQGRLQITADLRGHMEPSAAPLIGAELAVMCECVHLRWRSACGCPLRGPHRSAGRGHDAPSSGAQGRRGGRPEDLAGGVDGRLPQVQPVPAWPGGEGYLYKRNWTPAPPRRLPPTGSEWVGSPRWLLPRSRRPPIGGCGYGPMRRLTAPR